MPCITRHHLFAALVTSASVWTLPNAHAACTDIIALSKTTAQVVQSQDSLESNASAFCKEYKSQTSSSKSASYSASYKFLSASMGQSNAAESDVASKYCSSDASLTVRADAYRQYVESISPQAYAAYEACEKFSRQDISFDVNPASILPAEMSISASFAPKKESVSKLKYAASKDVKCRWTTKEQDGVTVLPSGSSTLLECERAGYTKPSFISIYEENSGNSNRLTIAWPAYNDNGTPLNLVTDLQQKTQEALTRLDQFSRSLSGAVLAFNASQCPAGWTEYAPAYGRFIRGIDKGATKADPAGPREPGNVQADALAKHSHELSLQGASGNRAFVNRTPAWGYDDWHGAVTSATTRESGGDETRPKNVALLYCQKG